VTRLRLLFGGASDATFGVGIGARVVRDLGAAAGAALEAVRVVFFAGTCAPWDERSFGRVARGLRGPSRFVALVVSRVSSVSFAFAGFFVDAKTVLSFAGGGGSYPRAARANPAVKARRASTTDVTVAVENPLHGRERLEPHRPAPVEPARRDADLGAEAHLPSVVEARRGVHGDTRRVDLAPEPRGVGLRPGSRWPRCGPSRTRRCGRGAPSRPSTTRTARTRSRNSAPKSSGAAARISGTSARARSSPRSSQPAARRRVAIGGQEARGVARVHEEALEGVAHPRTLKLPVFDDGDRLVEVTSTVEVGVTHTLVVLDDGDTRMLRHEPNERLAPREGSRDRPSRSAARGPARRHDR
jgi:hypothetical protein